jgi:hypothetical protein
MLPGVGVTGLKYDLSEGMPYTKPVPEVLSMDTG